MGGTHVHVASCLQNCGSTLESSSVLQLSHRLNHCLQRRVSTFAPVMGQPNFRRIFSYPLVLDASWHNWIGTAFHTALKQPNFPRLVFMLQNSIRQICNANKTNPSDQISLSC